MATITGAGVSALKMSEARATRSVRCWRRSIMTDGDFEHLYERAGAACELRRLATTRRAIAGQAHPAEPPRSTTARHRALPWWARAPPRQSRLPSDSEPDARRNRRQPPRPRRVCPANWRSVPSSLCSWRRQRETFRSSVTSTDGTRRRRRCVTDGRTTWSVAVQLPAGRHVYAFVVDGDAWVADPQAPLAPEQWYGQRNSVVIVASLGDRGVKTAMLALACLLAATPRGAGRAVARRARPETLAKVSRFVDSARVESLPWIRSSALRSRSTEACGGRASRRRCSAILGAAGGTRGIGPTRHRELTSGAGACCRRVERCSAAATRRSPKRSLTVPLVVLADLIARGVPKDMAARAIAAATRADARRRLFCVAALHRAGHHRRRVARAAAMLRATSRACHRTTSPCDRKRS